MTFSVAVTVLIKFIVTSFCLAFDFTKHEESVDEKCTFRDEVLEPTLGGCAWEWDRWGVTAERLHAFAHDPAANYRDDNDIFDCAWGCFFRRMGWLDEDIEGAFQVQQMLKDLDLYFVHNRIRRARRITSRCVFVNYPHNESSTMVPDCEQAKLLKNCLIKEVAPKVTDKNKDQLLDLLYDWLSVCADMEGLDVAEVLRRARRPPPAQLLHPAPPALHGCAWRCLFVDMGWLEEDKATFLLSVVRETIKFYYKRKDQIKELLKIAESCVAAANVLWENADVSERPHGCDRAQALVDCLSRQFLSLTEWNRTRNTGRGLKLRSDVPPRPPPEPAPGSAPAPREPHMSSRLQRSTTQPAGVGPNLRSGPRPPPCTASPARAPAPAPARVSVPAPARAPAAAPVRAIAAAPTPAPASAHAPAPAPAVAAPPAVRALLQVSGAAPAQLRSVFLQISLEDDGQKNSVTVNKVFENGVINV